jgi:hypothetical protein
MERPQLELEPLLALKFFRISEKFIFRSSSFSGLGLSIFVKNGTEISLDCPFKDFLYYYLARHSSVRA